MQEEEEDPYSCAKTEREIQEGEVFCLKKKKKRETTCTNLVQKLMASGIKNLHLSPQVVGGSRREDAAAEPD